MKNTSLLLRGCPSVILLAHVLICVILVFNYVQYPVPISTFIDPPGQFAPGYIIIDLLYLSVLALPPLASWAVSRPRWRRIGMLGLWISLPLTVLPCLYFGQEVFYDALNTTPHRADLTAWFFTFCFTLSFMACFTLALLLSLSQTPEQASIPVSQPIALEPGQHETAEQVSHSSKAEAVHATRWGLRRLFAFLGLLCHLLIGLSLFFTYTDSRRGNLVFSPETGWQLLNPMLQIDFLFIMLASLQLTALILPMPIYLASLLPFSWKKKRIDTLLFCIALSRLLNIIGLSISGLALLLNNWLVASYDSFHGLTRTTHIAFVVPPIAYFLSLVCSTILIRYGRRHKERTLSF